MEASNVALVLPAPSLLTPSSTPSPSGEGMGTESMLLLFDDIWMKLMELAKKLRDIMRSYNVENGLIAGQAVGHTAGGVMGLGAGVAQRQSDQDKAIADLQQNGAQSYNKSLTEIMEKATEIMQQIIGVGSSLVTVLAEILRALTR